MAAAAGVVLAACSGDPAEPTLLHGAGERVVVPVAEATGAQGVVDASWRAGFAALAAGGDGNAVVSPASLVVALAMLAEGASGDSAAALDEALGASGDERTAAVGALRVQLARYEGDPALVRAEQLPRTPMVRLADQVVVDDGGTPVRAYLDRLMAGYGAGVLVTDLASDDGVRRLDPWVRRNTGGLVERSAIRPAPDLALVLQDAIALAAAWETPFEAGATSGQTFTTADGTAVDVRMMHGSVPARYTEVDGWRAVRLPYSGDDGAGLWADLLLPPAASDVASAPGSADPAAVAAVVSALDDAEAGEVTVSMPRLDLAVRLDLLPVLERLGLGDLLSPATARLDRMLMDPPGPPYVGQAAQQAVLKVDEAGTRAAAVTELGVMAGSAPLAPPHEIVLDRPYLLAVEDGSTGWPLFLAAVLDPSA